MKRLFLVLSVLIFCVIAAALIGPSFVNWNAYKTQIQEQVKNQADLDLNIQGDVRLSLLPYPHLSAEEISLKGPQKLKYDALLNLKRVDIGLDLMPLLSGKITVSSMMLVEPKVWLERMSNGKMLGITEKIEQEMSTPAESQTVSTSVPQISFDTIQIKDATFAYYDHNTKTETILENVSGTVSAGSLNGPYKAEGSFVVQGRIFNFDIDSEGMKPGSKLLPAVIRFTAQPGNIALNFAGALNLGENFQAQGQIEISTESLRKTLSANNAGHQDSSFDGPASLKGFLNAGAEKAQIKDLEGDILDQKLSGQVEAVFEPFAVDANLKTAQPIDIQKISDAYPQVKKVSFDLALSGDTRSVSVSKGSVSLDDQKYDVSGQYDFKNKTGRPELNLNLAGKKLDVDKFLAKTKQKNSGETDVNANSLKQNIKINLPFDLAFSGSFDSIVYDGENIQRVKASGNVTQNGITLKNLSIGDFRKSIVTMSGSMGDLQNMKNIQVSCALTMKDAPLLASYFGLDLAEIPDGVKAGDAKFKLAGDAQLLDAILNVAAAHGELIAQGKIKNVLEKPQVDQLTVQVRHKNMGEALQIFSGSKQKNSQFSKPLDFYAQVQQEKDGSYAVSDIKADLSGMLMQGNAKLMMSDTKPSLHADLKFENIILAASGDADAFDGSSSSGAKQAQSRWSKDPIDLTALNALNADLQISAKRLESSPWVFIAPTMNVVLQEGVLSIKDFKGRLFEGTIAANATAQTALQSRQPIEISISAQTEKTNMTSLMKALMGRIPLKASGILNVDLDAKASGLSMAALIYDLNGKSNLTGSDIVLEGVDVERFAEALSEKSKAGDTALGLWKGVSKGGSTSFETLDGVFVITEGIVAIQKLDLDGPQASIFTTGKVDLPNWTLSTKHKITAKTRIDVPPFDMAFSGPLDNPAQTFGQGLLNDYLQRKAQRKIDKFVADKLGLPSEEEVQDISPAQGDEGTMAPQQNTNPSEKKRLKDIKPEDALKDVLKGILQ